MSADIQEVSTPAKVVAVENTPEVQADAYEEQAKEQGWKPKEEYEGDPNKWRPAKEFVERGELFGKIESMGKDLKETRKALKMLQEHHSRVRETEYNKALQELKGLQKRHLEDGNSDAYLETTELLTDLKAEQKAREVVQQNTPRPPDPRFVTWTRNNDWYSKDADLREYADTLGLGYATRHPDIDPQDVLEYVTKQVKEKFPNKFNNPNRNKPSAVEGSSAPPVKKESFELSEEERKVMNTFVRTGAMTREQYIEEVKRTRGAR